MGRFFIDILNSDWDGHERLEDKEYLIKLGKKYGYTVGDEPERTILPSVMLLKKAIRAILDSAIDGREASAASVDEINRCLALAPVTMILMPAHSEEAINKKWMLLEQRKNDFPDRLLADVALDFATLIATEKIGRIRRCENPECGFWYLDETRGGTKRWCDSKSCGNLMKVRRFRSRQKGKN